jgi:hypothetical protein
MERAICVLFLVLLPTSILSPSYKTQRAGADPRTCILNIDVSAYPLTVESTFRVSGSGTGFAATVSIFDEWELNDVKLGINADPYVGGFWLRFTEDGVATDYSLGIADVNYHTYRIVYDGSSAEIYIDNVLEKALNMTLSDIKIALHANARAIGDAVSAQFDHMDIAVDEFVFQDDFEDGTLDPVWIIDETDWMNVTEQQGVLDMTGTAAEQYWIIGGTAKILISDLTSAPVASFSWYPTIAWLNESLVFDASSSNGSIVNYAWDFGDGNITTVSEPVVSHRYSLNGTYLVTLNVTNNFGLWNTTSYQIEVTFQTDLNKDGTVNILDIFIVAQAFGSKPGDPNWNQNADINNDGTVNILDIFQVAWDFGRTV